MAHQRGWVVGDYNAICQRCGFRYLGSELVREAHTGLTVCHRCLDLKHPQEDAPIPRGVESVKEAFPEQERSYLSYGDVTPDDL